MSKTEACIVDCTTGTVVDHTNLYYCEASEKRMKKALDSDSSAFDLAKRARGSVRINPFLLQALLSNDIPAIARSFGWDMETDNSGQIVLYTGKRLHKQ